MEYFLVFRVLPICVNEGFLLGSSKHFTFLPQNLMERGCLWSPPPILWDMARAVFFQAVSAPGVPTLILQHLDEWPGEPLPVWRVAGLSALKPACLLSFGCIVVMEVQRQALGNLWPGVHRRYHLEEARGSVSYNCWVHVYFLAFEIHCCNGMKKKGTGSGWLGWWE